MFHLKLLFDRLDRVAEIVVVCRTRISLVGRQLLWVWDKIKIKFSTTWAGAGPCVFSCFRLKQQQNTNDAP